MFWCETLSLALGCLLRAGCRAYGLLGFLLGSLGFLECDLVFSLLNWEVLVLMGSLLPFEHFNSLFARLSVMRFLVGDKGPDW